MPDRAVIAVLMLSAAAVCFGCTTVASKPPVVARGNLPTLLPPESTQVGRSLHRTRTADRAAARLSSGRFGAGRVSATRPVSHRTVEQGPIVLGPLTGGDDSTGQVDRPPSRSIDAPREASSNRTMTAWGHSDTRVEVAAPSEPQPGRGSVEVELVPEEPSQPSLLLPRPASPRGSDAVSPPGSQPDSTPVPGPIVEYRTPESDPSFLFSETAAAHRIAVGDELAITFPYLPTFNQTVMVQADGRITLPLIEPVMAAGLTPDELQQELSRRYRPLRYSPLAVREGRIEKKYLISTGDRLEVRFDTEDPQSELRQLSDTVTVRPDGRISLPLIGSVLAEGKTPEELEGELTARYQRFYKEAEPVLIVREFTNNQVLVDGRLMRPGMKNIDDVVVLTKKYQRMVYVAGEVNRPGFVRLTGPMTVSQAIIAAGGFKRTAELRSVAMLRRGQHDQPLTTTLDLRSCWQPNKVDEQIADLPCRCGDVIIVPKTRIARVNDALDQYVYQLIPMTRNTQFQYIYQTGAALGVFGF